MSSSTQIMKTDSIWPIRCQLIKHEITAGMWVTVQWQLKAFDLKSQDANEPTTNLELYRDERTDYRFNLSSRQPKLFLVLDNVTDEHHPKLVTLTASQAVASQYLDGDYLVLSNAMPLPVQAWIEAFIGRHGELLETKKSKKRDGAGRSSES